MLNSKWGLCLIDWYKQEGVGCYPENVHKTPASLLKPPSDHKYVQGKKVVRLNDFET